MKHKFLLSDEVKKIGEVNREKIDNNQGKKAKNNYWNSFIEHNNFEVGVLKLKAGKKDIQNPHQSDEVYYIIEGDGKININGKNFDIEPKDVYYVPKKTPHRFHSNTKDIVAFYVLN